MKIKLSNWQNCEEPNLTKPQMITRNQNNKLKSLKENNNPNTTTSIDEKTKNMSHSLEQPIQLQVSTLKTKSSHQSTQSIKLQKENKGLDLSHLVYEKDIMKYVKSKESLFIVDHNYLNFHQNINSKLRKAFVKHFFKISKAFKLKRNTIFLAVYYMDFYFSKNHHVCKSNAIIFAEASLFIAMKYEEIYPPELPEWSDSPLKIINAESLILECLDFNLSYPSVENYLEYYFSKLDLTCSQITMIELIADVSLFEESMYNHTPCELSSAIIFSIANRSKLDNKMGLSLTEMLQKNEKFMDWLQMGAIKAAIEN